VAAIVKFQIFDTNEPDIFTIEAGQQLAAPIGISLFVPVTHYNVCYITTSKKYLINCHVLLKVSN